MPELINFRDFGGTTTRAGMKVKSDRLFRCGQLAALDPSEVERVLALDFAVIADLRYAGEREHEPSPWPAHYADRVIAHDSNDRTEAPHIEIFRSRQADAAMVDDFFHAFYANLPFDPLYRPLFARAITEMASKGGRTLIHCSAGKDRTGVMCALVLETLGVERDAILQDYMRSSGAPGLLALQPAIIARVERQFGNKLSEDAARRMLDVRTSYLERTLEAIDEQHGSVAAYLAATGVGEDTLDKLRSAYLEA